MITVQFSELLGCKLQYTIQNSLQTCIRRPVILSLAVRLATFLFLYIIWWSPMNGVGYIISRYRLVWSFDHFFVSKSKPFTTFYIHIHAEMDTHRHTHMYDMFPLLQIIYHKYWRIHVWTPRVLSWIHSHNCDIAKVIIIPLGLVQERRNYIANALESRLSCTNSSIWITTNFWWAAFTCM